ncbi:site-specific DNA-methyltransferase [Methanospirillum sp.]|uniref:site-specific DNA-methyltransferase n=1 Tax=Methanospirillum sp. TaxID=45200 RepID=UPI00359F77BE
MNQKSNKLPMKSPDLTADHIEQILSLFPQVLVKILGEDGTIRHGIDFDLLRQELTGSVVEGREERYEFTWVGKRRSIVEANRPVNKTLRPCVDESKDWENTKNIFIEGDNLDALKLLQESYLNAVKMIYIDPPYNTGNDFIYNDTFVMDSDEYDEEIEVIDEVGNRMFKNGTDRGRYHSDWCSMLYPRLKLAKNLLRDDGVIFVSIDDNEIHNLRKMMDEIFGEENFLVNICWQKRYTRSNNTVSFTNVIEYLLVYSKDPIFTPNLLPRTEETDSRYSNPDNDPRGNWKGASFLNPLSPEKRRKLCYPIKNPNTNQITYPTTNAWRRSKEEFIKLSQDNRLYWGIDGKQPVPSIKVFLSEVRGLTPINFWSHEYAGNTDQGTHELVNLLGGKIFENPKPVTLIKRIIEHSCDTESLILDFFSGTSVTAEAIMKYNSLDSGSRRFIMVQIPELCHQNSAAHENNYNTIAEIGKERMRRAGEQIKAQIEQENAQSTLTGSPKPIPDIGFRVFKVDDTNMKDVYYSATEYTQETIEGLINNVKEDRTDLDLLYQVLLSWGLKLDLTHTTETIDTFTIHHIDPENNSLIACFDSNIPEEVMRKIALMKPLRAVFRDGSFKDSPGKLNIDGIFKTLSPNTTVRVI